MQNVTVEQVQDLWSNIYGGLEGRYWDDDNPDVLIKLDQEFAEISEKYEIYDIIDSLKEDEVEHLSQEQLNNYHADLKAFEKAKEITPEDNE